MEGKEPHSLSLKVLRLSRPQLAHQHPLPDSTILNPRASLALPNASIDDAFTLTPLSLPSTFGTAYVGESFSCILGINNELPPSSSPDKRISSLRLSASMQTPSTTRALDLHPPIPDAVAKSGLDPAASAQSIIHFDLREEGAHTLSVSVNYSETSPSGGRARSFRKLYNFSVGPALSVRTKATELGGWGARDGGKGGGDGRERYALEAQLENLADDVITVEKLGFEARAPFGGRSVNWDLEGGEGGGGHVVVPTLAPREVTQVAFLLVEEEGKEGGRGRVKKEVTKDGRTILGVLTIHWRSTMGHLGVLSTGWLTSRKRG